MMKVRLRGDGLGGVLETRAHCNDESAWGLEAMGRILMLWKAIKALK